MNRRVDERDEDLQRALTNVFELISFTAVPRGWDGMHFQSVVLRNRGE